MSISEGSMLTSNSLFKVLVSDVYLTPSLIQIYSSFKLFCRYYKRFIMNFIIADNAQRPTVYTKQTSSITINFGQNQTYRNFANPLVLLFSKYPFWTWNTWFNIYSFYSNRVLVWWDKQVVYKLIQFMRLFLYKIPLTTDNFQSVEENIISF